METAFHPVRFGTFMTAIPVSVARRPCRLPALAFILAVTATMLAALPAAAQAPEASAAPPDAGVNAQPLTIVWQVRNRFRLFREERDFQLHVEALAGRSILQSETALAELSEGRGWARNLPGRLCIDPAGRIGETCTRDGVRESYLAPDGHRVTVRLSQTLPAGTSCLWTFNDGDSPVQQSTGPCSDPVTLRVAYGQPTLASVNAVGPTFPEQRLSVEIAVRDLLIAGLGDSIASGEGNPDRPVALSDDGFCFRSFLGSTASQYFRPGRAGFSGSSACDGAADTSGAALASWQKLSAGWLHAPCHRSLYSYQVRTALALAVANPHAAVTFLPLACTGASIDDGILGAQAARDCVPGVRCSGTAPAQLAQLKALLARTTKAAPSRKLDLLMLTVGANDIGFSELVADIILERGVERTIFRQAGIVGSVADSQKALARELPRSFVRLREALKPVMGGDLSRVMFVSYANPAMDANDTCGNGRDGFDVHPAFGVDAARLRSAIGFVEQAFLPQLRDLATCAGGVLCKNPSRERMAFVDAHQPWFRTHGVCARGPSDPPFDRACFSPAGESFHDDPVAGAANPLVCGRSASAFRAYAPRTRWIRTANDSYFAAMTFPQGVSSALQPTDIHDATWGIFSAVYGGAIHPSAEGHAAIADAAAIRAADILQLSPPAIAETNLPVGGERPAPDAATSEPVAPQAREREVPQTPDAPRPSGEIAPR